VSDLGLECTWLEDMCIAINGSVKCEILLNTLCNKHLEESAYVNYFTVTDSPCFFTGLSCVSQSWMNNNCADIKTNEIILYDDTELESCNEANILLLNFSVSCVWRMRYRGYGSDDGYCNFICYFTMNGLKFLL
jgi:hypothetical protein